MSEVRDPKDPGYITALVTDALVDITYQNAHDFRQALADWVVATNDPNSTISLPDTTEVVAGYFADMHRSSFSQETMLRISCAMTELALADVEKHEKPSTLGPQVLK